MKQEQYEQIIEASLERIKKLLIEKGKEYNSGGNPLEIFYKGAEKKGVHPLEVLDGFMLKHELSIDTITKLAVNEVSFPSEEVLMEKVIDNVNYLLIKVALIKDLEDGYRKTKRLPEDFL